ncbi:hypothetical protein B0H14DRAFT_500336 [Mycena olivaceomarginata]|nr:hypothetical protein B0H14DRAFT_500336 [Mycena olivaceomarginata]
MDIVIPEMDGICATFMIRKFDPQTPIISMTSSSQPAEIMTYFSSGMNVILPKPFTRDGLFEVLEKHLAHLMVIKQRMAVQGLSLTERHFLFFPWVWGNLGHIILEIPYVVVLFCTIFTFITCTVLYPAMGRHPVMGQRHVSPL